MRYPRIRPLCVTLREFCSRKKQEARIFTSAGYAALRPTASTKLSRTVAESSLKESRYYLILAQDLGYGQTDLLMNSLEEVSRPLNAYAQAFWLPAPDFWLPYPAAFWRDIKGAALARHKRE